MAKNKPQVKQAPKVAEPKEVKQINQSTKKSSGSGFSLPKSQNQTLLFDNLNYILFSIGAVLIVLGFILMSGGNTDPKVFNEAEIYSFRRITLAPITILIGFAIIGIGILKKPSQTITTA
ncbi:MAG: DUF3098 domain-containing protein [Sphingobacteriales bacterium]|jgi:uncharacterized membrane protein|nr:MAG: DUF3098 domain-containing protein [Sphingobacteriales bacterium]